jgi:hypothetical protein
MRPRFAIGRTVLAVVLAISSSGANAQAGSRSHLPVASNQLRLRVQEAAFLRTVGRRNTANVVTADLQRFAGTHIAYVCDVDRIVKPGLILGECGSTAEPLDLVIRHVDRHHRAHRVLRFHQGALRQSVELRAGLSQGTG